MDIGDQIPSFLLNKNQKTVHPEPVEGWQSSRSCFDKLSTNGLCGHHWVRRDLGKICLLNYGLISNGPLHVKDAGGCWDQPVK